MICSLSLSSVACGRFTLGVNIETCIPQLQVQANDLFVESFFRRLQSLDLLVFHPDGRFLVQTEIDQVPQAPKVRHVDQVGHAGTVKTFV